MAKKSSSSLVNNLTAIGNDLEKVSDFLAPTEDNLTQYDGFVVTGLPNSGDSNLPSQQPQPNRTGKNKRHIIHWFVPEMGIVKMYVNPENLTFQNRKKVNATQTKGGYSIQYWGEELSTISIRGSTGSSGIEGINMLYELYRAEQLGFDSVGLSIAAQNAKDQSVQQAASGAGAFVGQLIGQGLGGSTGQEIGGAIGSGLFEALVSNDGSSNTNLSPRAIPTLAKIAFGIEMYYMGWVFRGYFTSMNIEESATDFLMKYNMEFTVTQRRGYRFNYFPWSKSANSGPSDHSSIPPTFKLGK